MPPFRKLPDARPQHEDESGPVRAVPETDGPQFPVPREPNDRIHLHEEDRPRGVDFNAGKNMPVYDPGEVLTTGRKSLQQDIGFKPGQQQAAAPVKDLPGVKDLTGNARKQFGQFEGGKPVGMIIHHTSANERDGGQVGRALRYRGLGVNYTIDREGNISRLIPEGERGAHMREGQGPGAGLSNKNMAGVEIIADPAGGVPVNDKQIEAAGKLVGWHSRTYGYDPQKSVFGHGEVNPHKEREEGMEVVSRLRAGKLALGGEGPKPGSAEYWAQGRAPKQDQQVAEKITPPEPRPATRPGQDPVPPAPKPAVRPAPPAAVAEKAPAPTQSASAEPQAAPAGPKDSKTASAAPASNSGQRGAGRSEGASSSARNPRQGGFGRGYDGAGDHGGSIYGAASVRAVSTETELPETDGELHIRIDVPMSVV